MKALVIGGCGFIGSHVVDQLLARNIDVRVFGRRPEAFRAPLPQVDYVTGDLADTSRIFEALSGVDAVIHLASTTVPATSNLDPVADITGNLIATVHLLEVMRSAGVRKIIYLSSGGTVYGVPETFPIAESHPLRPISSYGIVKVAIENYLFMEQRLHLVSGLLADCGAWAIHFSNQRRPYWRSRWHFNYFDIGLILLANLLQIVSHRYRYGVAVAFAVFFID